MVGAADPNNPDIVAGGGRWPGERLVDTCRKDICGARVAKEKGRRG